MSTEKEPDYAGIAERLAKDFKNKLEVEKKMYGHASAPIAKGYASCMEARLRSDWETIGTLRNAKLMMHRAGHVDGCPMASLWDPSPCDCGLDAAFIDIDERISKLLEPFTP